MPSDLSYFIFALLYVKIVRCVNVLGRWYRNKPSLSKGRCLISTKKDKNDHKVFTFCRKAENKGITSAVTQVRSVRVKVSGSGRREWGSRGPPRRGLGFAADLRLHNDLEGAWGRQKGNGGGRGLAEIQCAGKPQLACSPNE